MLVALAAACSERHHPPAPSTGGDLAASTSGASAPPTTAAEPGATAGPATVASPTTQIAAVADGDGLALFYTDAEGGLWHVHDRASYVGASAPEALAAGVRALAAVNGPAERADEALEVVYVTRQGALFRRRRPRAGGPFGPAEALGVGVGTGPLAVARAPGGALEIAFGSAGDGALRRLTVPASGALGGVEPLDGPARAAVFARGPREELELYYLLASGELRRRTFGPSAPRRTEPETLARGAGSHLAVARNADGRLELFHDGDAGELVHRWERRPGGDPSASARLAPAGTPLAAVQNADGRLELFFADAESALAHVVQRAPNEGFGPAEPLGFAVHALAAARLADGRLGVTYLGDAVEPFHDWQLVPGRHWAGEYPLLAGTPARALVTAEPVGEPRAPLLPPRAEDWHVNDHGFARAPDGRWHFFGIVAPNPPRPHPVQGERRGASFGHATSAELVRGFRYLRERPFVEELGPGGVLWAPHVVTEARRYHMFYCTGGEPGAFAISHRSSDDLTTWSEPELLFRDGHQARDPMVLRRDEEPRFVLYYTATEDPARPSRHVVAYRTSSDLVRWSERAIAYRDLHVGRGYGPTESPFVVARDGWHYLFVGPRPYDAPRAGEPNWEHPGYVGTDVFRSRRFDRFTNADFVGHLAAHAAEVVDDADGTTYLSSAGIRAGGLFLARLHWPSP